MSCTFTKEGEVTTCKIDKDNQERCSKVAKEQGYSRCVYIVKNRGTKDE